MKKSKAKITITPRSYWFNSGGKGRGLIDTEINFHKTGFPKLKAGTFKGLLRESCLEILEIKGVNKNFLENIFGKEGNTENGALSFCKDFYLPNWDKILCDLVHSPIRADIVKNYFTKIISNTKIEDGTAADMSLRKMGVMMPMVSFETEVILSSKDEEELKKKQKLIEQGCHNLLYLGSKRNRGFGNVQVLISEWNDYSDTLSSDPITAKCIRVEIENLSVLSLPLRSANPNEISTDDKISGNRIRGVLAARYIQYKKNNALKTGKNYDPNDDDDFYDIFLSGKVVYGFCTKNGASPTPRNLHRRRGDLDLTTVLDIFQSDELKTSYIGDYLMPHSSQGIYHKVKIDTSVDLNMSRMNNRIAGSSTADDGAIYYEETIDENQKFFGHIVSDDEALTTKLTEAVGSSFYGNLGANKSTMGYCKINLSKDDEEVLKKVTGKEFQLILVSPTILLNEYGYAQINESLLIKAIEGISEDVSIDNKKAAVASTKIEQYVSLWRSRTDRSIAMDAGSTFILNSEAEISLPQKGYIGEMNVQGYGSYILVDPNEDYGLTIAPYPSQKSDQYSSESILREIRKYEAELRVKNYIKTMAVVNAVESKKGIMTNSAITNILTAFKNATTEAYINSRITDEKKSNESKLNYLGKKLAANGFVDEKTKQFIFTKGGPPIKNTAGIFDFNKAKIYWTEYFKTLRLINPS